MENILFIVILGAYVAATGAFLGYILFRPLGLLRFALWMTLGALLIHTAWLAMRLLANGYPFIHSNQDAYFLVAWTVVLLYVGLTRFYRIQGAGAFFLAAAVSLLILGQYGQGHYQFGAGTITSPWVVIHLFLAFLAFATFLVSFMIGIAFILQESRIKAKDLGGLTRKLPALEVLDGIHYKALALGLILLTAAIVAGTLLNKDVQGVFFTWDSKQIWVLLTWFLYAVLLQMRVKVGWRGRRGIVLSILGFVIVVLAFFGLQHTPLI